MSLEIDDFEEFKESVLEAYANGLDNNPEFFVGHDARDVAIDMIAFDATLEPYLDDEGDDEELIAILVSILEPIHTPIELDGEDDE